MQTLSLQNQCPINMLHVHVYELPRNSFCIMVLLYYRFFFLHLNDIHINFYS